PFLNSSMVGMPRTMKRLGTVGFSSIFSLATVARPSYSVASASTVGASRRQGPHHSAHRSTRTMPSFVSASKLLSVNVLTFSDAMFSPRALVDLYILGSRPIPRKVLPHTGRLDAPPDDPVLIDVERAPEGPEQRLPRILVKGEAGPLAGVRVQITDGV